MARVTVPIEDDLLRWVKTRPEDFGLLTSLSEGRRIEVLVKAGARFLREQRRDDERAALYAEWADDPEILQSAEQSTQAAIADGIL